MQQPPTAVLLQQSVAVGPVSTRMTCPSCHATISSRVECKTTGKTHLVALLVCLLFWPCMCVPYCMDTFKVKNHYCPCCNTFLGSYQ